MWNMMSGVNVVSGPTDVISNLSSGHNVTNLAASGGLIIEFYNPRKLVKPILFPSFIKSFTDRVTANFNDTTVYARMDPIYSYQNTVREINFSFDVVAYDELEASDNLEKIKVLQQLLYPTYYSAGDGIQVLTTPPFFQVKIGNLIEDEGGTDGRLLGVIDSFEYTPDFNAGMFTSLPPGGDLLTLLSGDQNRSDGLPDSGGNGRPGTVSLAGHMLPKVFSIDCNFKPIHSAPRGWDQSGNFTGKTIDVGARSARTIMEPSLPGSLPGTSAVGGALDNFTDFSTAEDALNSFFGG